MMISFCFLFFSLTRGDSLISVNNFFLWNDNEITIIKQQASNLIKCNVKSTYFHENISIWTTFDLQFNESDEREGYQPTAQVNAQVNLHLDQ